MDEEKINRIDNLREKLYSREHEDELKKENRRAFHKRDLGINETWKPAVDVEERIKKQKVPFIKILLIVSVVFFVGAALLSSFFLLFPCFACGLELPAPLFPSSSSACRASKEANV